MMNFWSLEMKDYLKQINLTIISTSILMFLASSCEDQGRVTDTTKPQYVISLAEISEGPYYSDSCLDCTDINAIQFQVTLSEAGEPLISEKIDFTTTATDGVFPFNHLVYSSSSTSNNGTLLFSFDDKGQAGTVDIKAAFTKEDTTVSANAVVTIEPYYTLVDTLITWLSQSSVVAGDTTSIATIYAQVKDTNNAALPNIPIQFMNQSTDGTLFSGDPNVNPDDPVYTNSLGKSSLNFKVESTNFSSSSVAVSAEISNIPTESVMKDTQYVSILSDNSDQVDRLEVWVVAYEDVTDNINITVIDTIYARALTQFGQAVSNVAVQFTKNTDGFGYISEASVLTDDTGQAKTIYYPYTQFNPENVDVQDVEFTVSIEGQNLEENITIGLDMSGDSNIEYDVEQFSFYPDYDFTTHILGNESEYSVIVKDANGVGVSNVPVRFSLASQDDPTISNGVLSSSIVYTCCSSTLPVEDDTGDSDTSTEDGTGDIGTSDNTGASTSTEQTGIAKVRYFNINGGTDNINAYIVDPLDAGTQLKTDELEIRTNTVSELNGWAKSANLYVTTLDSLFCDSLFVKAVDAYGNTLEDIQVFYNLSNSDVGGYINVVSDNTSNNSRTSTAVFCPDLEEFGNVEIITSTNIEAISDTLTITYHDELPECENCEAELILVSDQYILPYTDAGGELVPTAIITATMKDSLGYDPDPNTLIYFLAIQEDDDGNWGNVGSITDYGYFNDPDETDNDDELKAYTTFDMFDASGIVTIVGTSESLVDTIHISIESTEPSFIEIVPPYPNEIMVSGGGGQEATDLDVAIRDGDGNPVTEPYWVRFKITGAPEGTHLNGDPTITTGQTYDAISSNGISTVSVNSGSRPGSVQIEVELYPSDVNGDIDTTDDAIANAEGTPITIATGPPASGSINYSYVDITTIGGGVYQVPVTVILEDMHSNPVDDSTNVYFSVRGYAQAYDENIKYVNNNRVLWKSSTDLDSMVYKCVAPLESPLGVIPANFIAFTCQDPDNAYVHTLTLDEGFGYMFWERQDHPASIVAVQKTANENNDGESFPGIAWTNLFFDTAHIFDETIIFAQTWGADGTELTIDSRETHDGAPLDLPFTQEGTVSLGANPTAHDFTTGGTPVQISVFATINDYYQYPVDNGVLAITAPFSTIVNACNAIDDNGNGVTGWCCEDGNGDGDCQDDGTDTALNYFTCSGCSEINSATWEFDDSGPDGIIGNNDNDGVNFEGDGIQDDNPAMGISDKDGLIFWTIQYELGINICDCTDGNEVCEDRESNLSVTLQNPLQTTSDPVQVILSETDPTAAGGSCP